MNHAFAFDFSDDFDRAMYTGQGGLTLSGVASFTHVQAPDFEYVGSGVLGLRGRARFTHVYTPSISFQSINSHLLSGNMLFMVNGTWILKNRLSVAGSCMFNNAYLKGYIRGARYQ
jgi:hypothetical protein